MGLVFTACLAALLVVLVALYGGDPDDRVRAEDEQRPDMLPPPETGEEQDAEEPIEQP